LRSRLTFGYAFKKKGSLPMTKTTAHLTKIYGIDWSKTSADNIITCSLDKSVKVFVM